MNRYTFAFLLMTVAAAAQQPAAPAGQQPGPQQSAPDVPRMVGDGPPQKPADPRMMITAKQIQEMIAADDANVAVGKATIGDPMVMQGPYRATMEWRNTAQKSINVHTTDAEIFVIIEGSGELLLGGKLVNPRVAHSFPWEGPTLTAMKVEGATEYKVTKGDMIMIPANTPHTVSHVDGKLVLWSMHLPMGDSKMPVVMPPNTPETPEMPAAAPVSAPVNRPN